MTPRETGQETARQLLASIQDGPPLAVIPAADLYDIVLDLFHDHAEECASGSCRKCRSQARAFSAMVSSPGGRAYLSLTSAQTLISWGYMAAPEEVAHG